MHTIRGQALPATYLEHPHDPPTTSKPKHTNKAEEKEMDKKAKEKEHEKEKKKAFTKEQERMVSTTLLTTTAFLGNMAATTATTATSTTPTTAATSSSASVPPSPSSSSYSSSIGRNRSGSSTSSLTVPSAGVIEGNRSRSSSNTSSRPSSLLFRNKQSASHVDDKDKDHQHQHQHQQQSSVPQYHQQSHFFLQRHTSNPSSLPPPLLSKHSSTSTSSSSSSIFRRKKHTDPSSLHSTTTTTSTHIHTNHHSILMVPQHDIHITWPHPVPSGNIYIAGTWSVPGHGPWEKLAMTPVEGTDSLFEIHLNVNEIENIADYLDDEGHIHHELLDEGHHHPEEAIKLSKRQRLRRFFGRAKSKNSKDGATTPLPGQPHTHLPHTHLPHDAFLPLTREYHYQYKFVVDDEWKCDADRPQVRDSEGHWNHELVVELIEQIQGSSSSDSVRSRSSSLQSVQSANNAHLSDALPYQPQTGLPVDSSVLATKPSIPQEEEVKQVYTKASVSTKSRDTYEAVLIFDERDDLSDGEGGRILKEDDSKVTSSNKDVDQVGKVTAPTETVAIAVADASPEATQDATVSVASEYDLHAEDIFVSSSSIAERIELTEPTIIATDVDVAVSVALPESDVESDTSIDEALEVEPEPVPQQKSAFVLQEAANPEERPRAGQTSSSLSSLLSDDEEDSQERPKSIAIITETTPEGLSYQVPSPPLTPSSALSYNATATTFVPSDAQDNNNKQETDDRKTSFESTTSTAVDEHLLASVLLTPRSEHPSPFASMVLQEKEVVAVEPRVLEFDAMSEKASSSTTTSNESATTTTTTTTTDKDKTPRALPDKYPNLIWSICKTTVVVSAAVVVIGLGLGRQKK